MIERLIDRAAQSMNIDPAELRRRNSSGFVVPYKTPNGPVYDSGEFDQVLEKAQALAEWNSFPGAPQGLGAGRKVTRHWYRLLSRGGGRYSRRDGRPAVRPDGKVALRTGVQAMGQGHLSTFVPLVAGKLGIDIRPVRLVQGDSDEVPAGTPSVASRRS